MVNKKSKKPLPDFQSNDSLPVLHIDNVFISYRDDNIVFLNLTTGLPDGNIEQARIMIRDDDLKDVISDICKVIKYYPEKPSGKRSSPKKKE